MPRNREGELLGDRYRIEGSDGEGWAATDLTSGKRVHVAFVPRGARQGAEQAKLLTGAHIVKVLDHGETAEGATFIVREHCASDSLTKHLAKRGAMTVKDAIECALAVCDAIAEAHAVGLTHGALDASNVYLAFSASGLVDIQVAGIGVLCPPRPRDDTRSIVKLIDSMLGGRTPDDLKRAMATALRVLDLADALVPFAHDIDFAADRVEARRHRASASMSIFAEGGHIEIVPELAPAIRAVPAKPSKDITPAPFAAPKKPLTKEAALAVGDPTIIAPRPVIKAPRRKLLRTLGIACAAASVALLVVIGTEGARIAHTSHAATPTQAMELPPPPAPPPAVTAPPPPAATQDAVPVMHPSDLPPAKAKRKHH